MSQHYLVTFRSHPRSEHHEEYAAVATQMALLVKQVEGFLAYKTFTAEDGERVTIAEFASQEALIAWRNHPEHKEAQRLGREKFYASYRVQVSIVERDYTFEQSH